jgi:hypothetical protein
LNSEWSGNLSDWNPSSIYEAVILATAATGCAAGLPLLRLELAVVRRIASKGLNGELRNMQREALAWAIFLPFVQAVLVLTCAYRLTRPMHGHFVPSTTRFMLALAGLWLAVWVQQNRRRYPRPADALKG